ncbi:hypothetical protein ACVU7I_13165 [Patulibacter sp. S7RM1-6]
MNATARVPGAPPRASGPGDAATRWIEALIVRRAGCVHVVVRGLVASAVAIVAVVVGGLTVPTAAAIAVAGAYVLATTVLLWHAPVTAPSGRGDLLRALGDVVAITAVAAVVAPTRTEVILFLGAVPIGYSLRLPAAQIAAVTVACLVGAVACWAAGVWTGADAGADGALLLAAFGFGWCGLISSLVATERHRRAQRIGELSVTAQGLLDQAMSAEERERRRVADLLHDDVLQTLMATRQDVAEAMDGAVELLPTAAQGLDAVTARLRETVQALRDAGGAPPAFGEGIADLLEDAAEAGRFHVATELDRTTTALRHPVLLSIVRDLLHAAARTSAPTRVSLAGWTADDATTVVLTYDDRRLTLGLPLPADAAAPDATVRAAADRARALGGTLETELVDGDRSTTVRLPLPDAPVAPRAPAV